MKQRYTATRTMVLHLTWRDRLWVLLGWHPGFKMTFEIEHRPGITSFSAAARLERGDRTRQLHGGSLEVVDLKRSHSILPVQAIQPAS